MNATDIFRCVRTGPGRDDFRLQLKTAPHSVDTADAARVRLDTHTRVRDGRLDSINSGKVLALGDIFDGIARRWDAAAANVRALPAGSSFAAGVPRGAEQTPSGLDLGMALDGLTAVEAAIEQERAKAAASASTNTADRWAAERRATGDRIADINKANAEFWRAQAASAPR
jgi:hypothetical protein